MYNLVDLVQLDTEADRETVEKILSSAVNCTVKNLEEGNDVYWVGLCRFTWKKKAPSKKKAQEWKEYPYLADGDKVRCVPVEELDQLDAKDGVTRMKRNLEEKPTN